uniref:Myb/SANT-like domain-containing protein n=1 Tax=Fagus sylvatica TaxID=28930 RepID=A0A2N9GZZ6_FAGSY
MATELNDAEDQKLWPPQIEKLFIDLIVEECIKENMPDGVFKRFTWNIMVTKLNACANRSFNHKQLKTKFNRLRIRHRIFSQLLEHTGMGWNPVTNTVTASEEVWQNVLAATPKAKEFRKKGCDHYDKLGTLFNKTTAIGLLAFASTEDPTNTEEERELDEQYWYGGIHVNVDAGSDDETVQVPPNMGKVKCPTHEEKGKEKKPKKEDKISDMTLAIREFTEVSRQRFERRVARTSGSCVGESKRKIERFSLDKAVEALSVYKDMPRTAYLKVMKALYKKENVAFLAMTEDRKIE